MEFMTPAKQRVAPVEPEDLTNKEYVDRVVAAAGGGPGGIADVPGLQSKLDQLTAADAGKMPMAPNDGRQYEAKGGSWVEAAAGSIGGGGGGGGGWAIPDPAKRTQVNWNNGTYTAEKTCFVSVFRGSSDGGIARITLNGSNVGIEYAVGYTPLGNQQGTVAFVYLLPMLKGDVLQITAPLPTWGDTQITVFGVRYA